MISVFVFQKRKIKIHLNTALKEASIYKVFLSNGKSIETNTVISTIGSTVSKIIKKSGLPLKNGKIKMQWMNQSKTAASPTYIALAIFEDNYGIAVR